MIKDISRKLVTHVALPAVLLFTSGSQFVNAQRGAKSAPDANSGTLEKMVVSTGTVAMQVDWARLTGGAAAKSEVVQFRSGPSTFMTALVFNDEFRTVESGAISLVPMDSESVPEPLHASLRNLAVEKMPSENAFEFAVRDSATGFVFFNIDRNSYSYDASTHALSLGNARLLVSSELAKQLGRPADAGTAIGTISITAAMYPIEVATVVNGNVQSATMPTVPLPPDPTAFNAGPDVIVGDMPSMDQAGSFGGMVGLEIGTTSCNTGNVELNWFAMPNVDHPVIPQNFYRMSASGDRFEHIGQSWLKHAFTALQQNACSFGCTPAVNGTHLGVGCSDPYSASLNGSQSGLGSRAWVNPFTGAYPSTARDHTGHAHTGTSHRVLVDPNDLNTTLNPGAAYFAEAQYVTPHEYAWCQSHAGECNMYNNASYRRFNVSGTTSFSFSANGATVRMTPAILAWTGATVTPVEPAPGTDGRAFVAYKVTGPVNGLYHYEYAVNNQNLDRSIQSFSVPLTCGANVSNIGFHAPLNEAGSANDGTGGSGISNAAWTTTQTATAMTWNTQTFAENANANAIRWGTLFNFRFDSPQPPTAANATIGYFKTGSPTTVAIQVPSAACTPLQIATVVSRKDHGGTAYDVDMPLGATQSGVECRNGGVNGNHTLVVSFSNNITSGNASLTAPSGGSVSGSPVIAGNTMTINLSGVADLQQTAVALTGVTDGFGQTMPDTMVNVAFLYGDTGGDRQVNIADTVQTRGRSGATLDGSNFRSDVNTDGTLNGGDVVVVRGRSGNSLPPL
ncbi:MAG: hypothetical protein ACR2ID_01945 [Chthoniobacterales bacterium]